MALRAWTFPNKPVGLGGSQERKMGGGILAILLRLPGLQALRATLTDLCITHSVWKDSLRHFAQLTASWVMLSLLSQDQSSLSPAKNYCAVFLISSAFGEEQGQCLGLCAPQAFWIL